MFVAKRGFAKLTDVAKAAQGAVQQRPKESAAARQPAKGSSVNQSNDLKITRLPHDLLILSQDSNDPISRVAVVVKAGSRHEPKEVPGLSHALRNSAALATRACSAYGLSRNLEQLGATLSATTTRDHIIYNLTVHRRYLPEAMKFLGYVTAQQEFKNWEVKDSAERLDVDLQIYDHHPEVRVVEHLHKAAFRDGLANSLFAPKWASHHYKSKMLRDYVKYAFKNNRMAISASGVGHDELITHAANNFKLDFSHWEPVKADFEECLPAKGSLDLQSYYHPEYALDTHPQDSSANYSGGEYFENTLDYLAYVAVAVEGAGINKPKDLLSFALLQQVLGVEPHVKWSRGQNVSPLVKAATGSARNDFAISAFNVAHSDSGLFGFSVVAHARDVANIVHAAVGVLQEGKGVDLQRLDDAKNRLVASILMRYESKCEKVNDSAVQALASGHVLSPDDAVNIVRSIRGDDIVAGAQNLSRGRMTMAAVGNLSHLPRLDQLM